MKIIFLDHDGVICLPTEWGSRHKKQKAWGGRKLSMTTKEIPLKYRFDNFNTEAIKILNEILETSGAEIVVSSDWKNHATLEEMGKYYEMQGIAKKPIAFTPFLWQFDPQTNDLFRWKGWLEKARILEIREYLKMQPEITNWACLDDLPMSRGAHPENGLENFVQCWDVLGGIKEEGLKEKILAHLL